MKENMCFDKLDIQVYRLKLCTENDFGKEVQTLLMILIFDVHSYCLELFTDNNLFETNQYYILSTYSSVKYLYNLVTVTILLFKHILVSIG